MRTEIAAVAASAQFSELEAAELIACKSPHGVSDLAQIIARPLPCNCLGRVVIKMHMPLLYHARHTLGAGVAYTVAYCSADVAVNNAYIVLDVHRNYFYATLQLHLLGFVVKFFLHNSDLRQAV